MAIADYQSEADEDASAQDREETKRLLYVALTRARDRLYLSASVPQGKFRSGRGSLADVLPDDLKGLFAKAWRPAAIRPGPVRPGRGTASSSRLRPRLLDSCPRQRSAAGFVDDFEGLV